MKIYWMEVTYNYPEDKPWRRYVSVENAEEFIAALKYTLATDALKRFGDNKEPSEEFIVSFAKHINVKLLDTGLEDFPRSKEEVKEKDDEVLV